jgi:hypothetical protein
VVVPACACLRRCVTSATDHWLAIDDEGGSRISSHQLAVNSGADVALVTDHRERTDEELAAKNLSGPRQATGCPLVTASLWTRRSVH